jgi:hypothetical protein
MQIRYLYFSHFIKSTTYRTFKPKNASIHERVGFLFFKVCQIFHFNYTKYKLNFFAIQLYKELKFLIN